MGLQPEPGGEERQFREAVFEGDIFYFVVDKAKGPRERADPGWLAGFHKRNFLVTGDLGAPSVLGARALCSVSAVRSGHRRESSSPFPSQQGCLSTRPPVTMRWHSAAAEPTQ